jgi:hypothetical protein
MFRVLVADDEFPIIRGSRDRCHRDAGPGRVGQACWDRDGRVPSAGALRESRSPRSTIANSIQHVFTMEQAFVASGQVTPIGAEYRRAIRDAAAPNNPAVLTVVPGLEDLIARAFRTGRSFAELGAPWGRPGRTIRPDLSYVPG